MAQSITKYDDIIDSREVIARIAELEAESDGLEPDELEELITLRALAEEASSYAADWQYGEALIRDSHFEDYAQELAADCGMIPADLKWPCTCIDWAQAAKELQQDYTAVEFGGVTYWIR